MTNKSTKRALLSSVMALFLCFAMLLGTTFAWFTDSVESGTNKIVSGNLDVDLYHTNKIDTDQEVDSSTKLFDDIALWEPGAVVYENFEVANNGTLALKYALTLNVSNVNETASGKSLVDVLKVAVVEGGFDGDREDAKTLAYDYSLSTFSLPGDLLAGKSDVYGIVIYWEPTANDNAYNVDGGLSATLGVSLLATQVIYENDSFGPDYDGGTPWTGGVDYSWYDENATELTISSAEQLAAFAALTNGNAAIASTYATTATVADNFAGKTIKLTSNIDLAGKLWTPIADPMSNNYVGFEGTFDGNGFTVSNLFVNDVTAWGQGLFGYMTKAVTIQNVNINNAIVIGDECLGVVAGYAPYATIKNVNVSGDVIVTGLSNVAAILGHGYYADITDCSVKANVGSSITATVGSFAAGIIGYHATGDHKISGCDVENLAISALGAVGGIAGISDYGTTITNCSVKNVTLTKTGVNNNPSIGIFLGSWEYHATSPITLTNNVAENVSLYGTHKEYSAYNVLFGSEYSGKTDTNFVGLDTNSITGINNHLIPVENAEVVTDLATLQAKLDAANGNTVIALGADITGDVTVTKKANTAIVLDGRGYKINGAVTINGMSAQDMTSTLVVKNVVFDAATISGDACIKLGGENDSRYTANVTIENCTFDVADKVGVKSYTGGDKNLTITGCTATEKAHSLAQLKGVDGVLVENCIVNSVRGINFNNSNNATVTGTTMNVQKYAVRYGADVNTGVTEKFAIIDSTFESQCAGGDAVVVFRADALDATITLSNATFTGPVVMQGAENVTFINK